MRTVSSLFRILVLPGLTVAAAVGGTPVEATGIALAVPFQDGVLAVTWGWAELLFVRAGEPPVPAASSLEDSRPCSPPSTFGDTAALCVRRADGDYVLSFTPAGGTMEYGPYNDCGAPVFDGSGSLWFTADGFLYNDGTSTGLALEAHTISPDSSGGWLAYCDRNDRLCLMETIGGETRVLASNRRFFAPQFITIGRKTCLLSSSLEGEIVLTSASTGAGVTLARGSHPCWWSDREILLYSVTEDDGHRLTSADIWHVSPGGTPAPVAVSEDALEIQPFVMEEKVMAVDAATGSLLQLPDP
ncbi:MAG: hypothetical protein R6U39_07005 [Candidatus Aegiribacteria sp.]